MEKWGVWVAKEQNWGCEVGGPVFDMCLVHALVVFGGRSCQSQRGLLEATRQCLKL